MSGNQTAEGWINGFKISLRSKTVTKKNKKEQKEPFFYIKTPV